MFHNFTVRVGRHALSARGTGSCPWDEGGKTAAVCQPHPAALRGIFLPPPVLDALPRKNRGDTFSVGEAFRAKNLSCEKNSGKNFSK